MSAPVVKGAAPPRSRYAIAPPAPPRRGGAIAGAGGAGRFTPLILLVEGVSAAVRHRRRGACLAGGAGTGGPVLAAAPPGRVIAVAAPELDVSIGHLAIAWAGFRQGPDQPVQVTGDAISVADRANDRSLGLDHAGVDLSMAWALRGVFAPRVITLDGMTVTLRREPRAPPAGETAGETTPQANPRQTLRDIIAVLREPAQSDTSFLPVTVAQLSELRRVTLTRGSVTFQPAADSEGQPGLAGKALQVGEISATVLRGASGGLTGQISAVLASRAGPLPPETAGARPSLQVSLAVSPEGEAHVDASAKLDDPAGMMAAIEVPAAHSRARAAAAGRGQPRRLGGGAGDGVQALARRRAGQSPRGRRGRASGLAGLRPERRRDAGDCRSGVQNRVCARQQPAGSDHHGERPGNAKPDGYAAVAGSRPRPCRDGRSARPIGHRASARAPAAGSRPR